MLKVLSIKKIFIKRMIISTLMQFMILAFVFVVIKSYIISNEKESLANVLTINDSFSQEELTRYKILENNYAFDLSLRNIADERKLDAIWFSDNLKPLFGKCVAIGDKDQYWICNGKNGVYYGVTPLKFNHKIIGYVIASKKYGFFETTIYYDLAIILIAVMCAFLFNFLFLFLSIKNNFEKNTQKLLSFISNEDDNKLHTEISIKEYSQIAQKFIEKRNEISLLEKEKYYNDAMQNLAAQVAHDIRSPLIAADSFFHLIEKKLDESERVFGQRAISRLNDIAWSLLSKYKKKNENHEILEDNYVFISSCIQEILAEKRMEYTKENIEFEFSADSDNIFNIVHLNAVNLKRALSNLINNAVNAIVPNNGLIKINLNHNMFGHLITIKDNGCGMKPEVLQSIMESAKSEKAKTNLGLPHAVKFFTSIGGKLDMETTIGTGTTVYVSLPNYEIPAWCVKNYSICDDDLLLIIDDCQSVHDVWDEMLKKIPDVQYQHFYTPDDALAFFKATTHKHLVIFCDYEFFGADQNGVDILSQAPDGALRFLVTSHLYNPKIMQSAIEKGFNILPKDLAPHFRLNKSLPKDRQDEVRLIFIDNEKGNTDDWQFFADHYKVNIVTYNVVADFLKDTDRFSRHIPIYIDLDLGEAKNGIEYAKDIYALGFKTIYIATGAVDDRLNKEDYPWIIDIRDKKFPLS